MSATGILIFLGTMIGIYALLSLGLNIKFGTTGILDFGHVAYYLVGAYVVALITVPPASTQAFQDYILGFNLPARFVDFFQNVVGTEVLLAGGLGWLIAILAAMIAAAFLGLVVALPTIRLRADYLAIALLGVSVILQRVVQSPPRDVPLVNGPDTLQGYSRPFNELFPLPGDDLSSAILLGLIVFTVWILLLWLIAKEATIAPGKPTESRLIQALLAITTLGIGYWAITRSRTRRARLTGTTMGPQMYPKAYLPIIGASAVFGALAFVASFVGSGSDGVLVTLGVASTAGWVGAWIKLRNHYDHYTKVSAAAGLAIVVGVVIAFGPAFLFGSEGGVIGYGASFLTFFLFVMVGVGLVNIDPVLDRFNVPGDRLGIVGIATAWLLALWYFVGSVDDIGDPSSIIESTRENLFWLVEFETQDGIVGVNYSRFLFILVITSVVFAYLLVQAIHHSPHGRVLKAVRDDENVAMALGKNSFMFKVQALIVGSAIGGLAGAMWAIHSRALHYNMFHPRITFFVFLAVILGGRGNHKGVILGAALFWIFRHATGEFAEYFPPEISNRITVLRWAIIGLAIIAILYYRPAGLWKEQPPHIEVGEG